METAAEAAFESYKIGATGGGGGGGNNLIDMILLYDSH